MTIIIIRINLSLSCAYNVPLCLMELTPIIFTVGEVSDTINVHILQKGKLSQWTVKMSSNTSVLHPKATCPSEQWPWGAFHIYWHKIFKLFIGNILWAHFLSFYLSLYLTHTQYFKVYFIFNQNVLSCLIINFISQRTGCECFWLL